VPKVHAGPKENTSNLLCLSCVLTYSTNALDEHHSRTKTRPASSRLLPAQLFLPVESFGQASTWPREPILHNRLGRVWNCPGLYGTATGWQPMDCPLSGCLLRRPMLRKSSAFEADNAHPESLYRNSSHLLPRVDVEARLFKCVSQSKSGEQGAVSKTYLVEVGRHDRAISKLAPS
jgi:hypothetical protein